jgi:DNA-binding LacI/PurR family transcriptional regulator
MDRPVHPTIRDVAAAAGVSVTTVSDSLSGKGRIGEVTRRRVRQVADELGYRPSTMAQSLRVGRSRFLGIVVTKYGATPWTFTRMPFFSKIVDAAVDAAIERGYAMAVLPADRPADVLMSFPLDGLFVVDPLVDDPVVRGARRRGLPVVSDRANATRPEHLWVDLDYDEAISLMCDHLISEADRSPVLLTSDGADSYTRACVTAYKRWCTARRKQPQILRAGQSPAAATAAVREFLRTSTPDAIFGLEDFHLEVLQAEVLEAGLQAPADIALGCFTEAEQQPGRMPMVTRLTVKPQAIAANAVTLLIDIIEGRPVSKHLRVVGSALVD